MKITLKDGSVKEYAHKMSIYEIAKDISEGLARVALAGCVNDTVLDLRTVLDTDCELQIVTVHDKGGLDVLRHSASHVLAQAVKSLYPHVKLAIGPSIENGFYYDFEAEPFSKEDLANIEAKMKELIKADLGFERFCLERVEAISLMEQANEPYKVELIQGLEEDSEISFYRMGKQGEAHEFVDLCAGPHVMSTKQIKAFSLISSSGAYWRGKSENAMLQRIYGTAFFKKEDLQDYLAYLEDVKKRDHNKIGREMELFASVDVIGQGLPLLLPKGAKIMQTLQRWIEDEEEMRGYVRTKTPMLAKKDLYVLSDHWGHYKEGMFILGDETKEDTEVFALRPMTCPFQYYVYKQSQKSYRDLPLRYAETATLFRNEDSGEMHGLTRVRQFTISEGHLIIRPDQLEEEFRGCVDLVKYCLQTLGLSEDVSYRMSKWDPDHSEKYMGDEQTWNRAQDTMRDILEKIGISFTEADGEAAFYGPKLDIQAKNVYGKEDTMITIQLDMFLAERFDMYYVDQNGEKKRPYVIHRTSVGCYERTLAWLIEKYMGKFPTWLCSEQVRILPISEKHMAYANQIEETLKAHGILCTTDHRSEKIGYKIRESRLARVPYMLVIGKSEEEEKLVSVRSRFVGDEGVCSLASFIEQISKEIQTKEIRKEVVESDKK